MAQQVTDAGLASALAQGDQQAFAELYERYSDRIYSYCMSVCGNPELAADATQDSFLLAHSRVGQLRDPNKLRSWLYAIARNECLRQLRAHKQHVDLEKVGEVVDPTADLDGDLAAADARRLIDDAFAGMNSSDREVLDLALRQDLDNGSIAEVLGVSDNNAAAKVSRAKAQLEKAVGALLLFRGGSTTCDQLGSEIGPDQAFTPLSRKRIARHAQSCPNCSSSRKRSIAAIAMVGLPLLVAPTGLRDALFNSVSPVPGAGTSASDGDFGTGSASHPGSEGAGSESGPASPNGTASSNVPGPDGGAADEAGPHASDISYVSDTVDVPALSTVARAAQVDRARPPFDSQGWPRSKSTPGKNLPLVAAVGAAVLLMVGAAGLALTGETEVPTAGQADSSAAPIAATTQTAIPSPTVVGKDPTKSKEPSSSSSASKTASGSESGGGGTGSGSGNSGNGTSSPEPKPTPSTAPPAPGATAGPAGGGGAGGASLGPRPGGPGGIALPPAPIPG